MKFAGSFNRSGCGIAALALAVLTGGCTGLQPPHEDAVTLHLLAAEPLASAAQPQRDMVIAVAPPRAWPGFDTPQMAYVQRVYELDYFATNRWADTPSRMLGPLLARALEQTGSFRAVVQAPSTVPADLRLDVEIVRLQQNFTARPSREEVTLRAQLTDVRAKRVIATRVFEGVESASNDDAAGGVAAANAALRRMLSQIADFCVAESTSP